MSEPKNPLEDGASVDLEAEFQASNIQEVLDKLDRELIGLVPVKTRIREIAALLLAGKADINAKAKTGGTPLHEAENNDHKELAEWLRQHGGHE